MLERTWTNYHIKINSFHLDIEWKIGKIQSIMLIDIYKINIIKIMVCVRFDKTYLLFKFSYYKF